MSETRSARLDTLERRLTGPKRIGLFGHRAVGKTTLLAMFYREASTGRVPGLRLAATDPAAAEYLAEKIAQIESGEPPAGTLAETELKLRLHRGTTRLDLIVKDYQGEDVTLGSDEPIHQFFADCDAVLLCLDPETSATSAERRRRQQEVEQLLEKYIENAPGGTTDRPVALLITKYDRVLARHGREGVETLVDELYGMTRHALAHHVRRGAMFAVSSYGIHARDGRPPADLEPMGLDAPLLWLVDQLEALDYERLEELQDLAPGDSQRLARCLKALERRYPKSSQLAAPRARLKTLAGRRNRRRLAAAGLGLAGLVGALAGYDAWGFAQAQAYARDHAPLAVSRHWSDVLTWHPTLGLFRPDLAREARRLRDAAAVEAAGLQVAHGTAPADLQERLRELKDEAPQLAGAIEKVETVQDRQRHDRRWTDLKTDADVGTKAPEVQLASLEAFLREYPETPHRDEAVVLVGTLKERVEAIRLRAQRQELEDLIRSETLPNADLAELIDQGRQFLKRYPESPLRGEVERKISEYAQLQDDRDINRARQYSRQYPTHFATRIEKFQDYLKAHPTGGRFVSEAMEAKDRILREWDTSSYRQAQEHLEAHPDDLQDVARRLRDYLRDHPEGRRATEARAFLKWFDLVNSPRDYTVTLRRGEFDPALGKYLAGGGPDLGIVVEVAGVRYGPTPVIKDSHRPIWDYTFPKPVRWKLGDPVTVRVIDYDWSDSEIITLKSRKGDPLAIRLLSDTIKPAGGGPTALTFRSNFVMPDLPPAE